MNWCSKNVFNGIDGSHIKNITSNMFYYLHNKINIFNENTKTINIWKNIYNMFNKSNDVIFKGLKNINIRNDIFLDVLNHNDYTLKVKVTTPSSIPGLCVPINVSANNSYIISLNIFTKPKFAPIDFLFLNKEGNVINLLNYVIKKDDTYFIYFKTNNVNFIRFMIGLKNNYKNDIIEYNNLIVKKINNDILYNL